MPRGGFLGVYRSLGAWPDPTNDRREAVAADAEHHAGDAVGDPVVAEIDRREPQRDDDRQAQPEEQLGAAWEHGAPEPPAVEQASSSRSRSASTGTTSSSARGSPRPTGPATTPTGRRTSQLRRIEPAVDERRVVPRRAGGEHDEAREADAQVEHDRRRELAEVGAPATHRQHRREHHRQDEVHAVRQREPVGESGVARCLPTHALGSTPNTATSRL